MKKPKSLFVDQYGNHFWADTLKELRSQIANGGSNVSLMYEDFADGTTYRTGYVIGPYWLKEYRPVYLPAGQRRKQS